jgi:hypothetical protein
MYRIGVRNKPSGTRILVYEWMAKKPQDSPQKALGLQGPATSYQAFVHEMLRTTRLLWLTIS